MNLQMFKLVLDKAEEPEIKLPTSTGSSKNQESSRRTSISALLAMPKPLTVWTIINWKILKEMGIPDYPTCLLRNVYAGQKATVRTGHGTTGWFQIGKRVCQGYILFVKIKQSQKKQISCHLNIFTYQTPARVLGQMILEVLILSLIFLKIFWFMCWPLALYRDRHRKKEENTKT